MVEAVRSVVTEHRTHPGEPDAVCPQSEVAWCQQILRTPSVPIPTNSVTVRNIYNLHSYQNVLRNLA